MIKIQNVYYMLAYAYKVLNQANYRHLATEQFEYINDLFAAILAKGIANQIRKGLEREYASAAGTLRSPRGKIDISQSIKRQTMLNKQLACQFDEFTENTYMNKIIKSTGLLLVRSNDVSIKSKKDLRKAMLFLAHVDEIDLYRLDWSKVKYHRNNATYKMLMNVCYLIMKGMIQTEHSGSWKLANYVDGQEMHSLFESFVREYYRKHYPQYKVSAAHIEWNVDDGIIDFLPRMKPDITIEYEGKVLIIDTKFYQSSVQTNTMYNSKKIYSDHLYQIFSYVKNKDVNQSGLVSGMLLYAKTEGDEMIDNVYTMDGNRIHVRSLDLNQNFHHIEQQLDEMVNWLHNT